MAATKSELPIQPSGGLTKQLLGRRARRSYPEVNGFRRAAGVLDLRHVWHARPTPRGPVPGKRAIGPGLSAMSAAVLGKPLDKSMQVGQLSSMVSVYVESVLRLKCQAVLVERWQRSLQTLAPYTRQTMVMRENPDHGYMLRLTSPCRLLTRGTRCRCPTGAAGL